MADGYSLSVVVIIVVVSSLLAGVLGYLIGRAHNVFARMFATPISLDTVAGRDDAAILATYGSLEWSIEKILSSFQQIGAIAGERNYNLIHEKLLGLAIACFRYGFDTGAEEQHLRQLK